MIIAHLTRAIYPCHSYGGLEQHAFQLTRELARQGHTVHLFTQTPDLEPSSKTFCWPDGIHHHFISYQTFSQLRKNSIPDRLINYPIFSIKLAKEVIKINPAPDIVHAHGLAAYGYARNPMWGIPLILNPHGMEEFKNSSLLKQIAYSPFRRMVRYSAQQASAVIATDKSLVPEVQEFLEVPIKKVALIPNAVDLEKIDLKLFTSKKPPGLGIEKPPLLILSVGRLEQNKGYEVALKALKKLEHELPEGWRWLIVGTGSMEKTLKAKANQSGFSNNLIFAGKLGEEELYGCYRLADFFLHPTLYEGSSLVTLEAMASGLPVIVSNTGGLPDKVWDRGSHKTGYLVEPGNTLDLVEKIRELLALAPSSRRVMGKQGRYHLERNFTMEVAGKETIALYKKMARLNSYRPVLAV